MNCGITTLLHLPDEGTEPETTKTANNPTWIPNKVPHGPAHTLPQKESPHENPPTELAHYAIHFAHGKRAAPD